MPRPGPCIPLALFALACGAASPVSAQVFTDKSGNKLTFYGQLDFAYLGYDDGFENYNDFGDNNDSTSRLGFTIDHPMGESMLQFRFETGLGIVQTKDYSQDNQDPQFIDWQRTDLRKFEISYKSGFGTIYLGQGSMATDNAAEVDQSGTSVAGYATYNDIAGGFLLRNEAGALTDLSVGSIFKSTDGTRRFRIRYDTPAFHGFTLEAAYGQEILQENNDNIYYDTALWYKDQLGRLSVQGALGYAWTDPPDGDTTGQSVFSVSVLDKSGVSVTFSAGGVEDSGSYWYGKLGYTHKWLSLGDTSVAAEYYESNGFGDDTGDGQSWGIMAVQKFDDYKTELYIGYREYTFEDDTTDYKDSNSLALGARWRF